MMILKKLVAYVFVMLLNIAMFIAELIIRLFGALWTVFVNNVKTLSRIKRNKSVLEYAYDLQTANKRMQIKIAKDILTRRIPNLKFIDDYGNK